MFFFVLSSNLKTFELKASIKMSASDRESRAFFFSPISVSVTGFRRCLQRAEGQTTHRSSDLGVCLCVCVCVGVWDVTLPFA